jgi:hypothetical protein
MHCVYRPAGRPNPLGGRAGIAKQQTEECVVGAHDVHGSLLKHSLDARSFAALDRGKRYGLSLTYKITPSWVTLLQPARRPRVGPAF